MEMDPSERSSEKVSLVSSSGPQSAGDLILKPNSLVRWFFLILIPFGINLGFAYLIHKGDYVGVFKPPDTSDPEQMGLVFDFAITGFFTAFFSTLFTTAGLHKQVQEGNMDPISSSIGLLQSPKTSWPWKFYRVFPLTAKNVWLRCFLQGVILDIPLVFIVGCCFVAVCSGQDIHPCKMAVYDYRFVKAAFAGMCTFFLYPAILLSALDRNNMPDKVLLGYDTERPKKLKRFGNPASSSYGSDSAYSPRV